MDWWNSKPADISGNASGPNASLTEPSEGYSGYTGYTPPTNAAPNVSGANNLMYATMAMSAISSVGNAYSQSRAIKAQGAYQQAVSETNAKLARLQSDQAREAGDIMVSRRNLETRGVVGAQRAAAGASGTDVNVGSNVLVREGSELAGTIDELTIKNNAARQAWGHETTAIQDTFKGQFDRMTSAAETQQTLLAGGMQAVSGPLAIYSNYKRNERSMGGGSGPTTPYDMRT